MFVIFVNNISYRPLLNQECYASVVDTMVKIIQVELASLCLRMQEFKNQDRAGDGAY